ncbi:hypothetical protein BT96DRAFT_988815 [Gymnopus androsaceus JB14]|uniref:Uncharacterized protein n=1 Tax=Gymnopus androsaceus JB14 TaxID=1447944 RepID=A0A6A4I500_9AGAR|nr:hypothetical protein BT96DRAFT_988815 [Gymnopus androsaceus JB14]
MHIGSPIILFPSLQIAPQSGYQELKLTQEIFAAFAEGIWRPAKGSPLKAIRELIVDSTEGDDNSGSGSRRDVYVGDYWFCCDFHSLSPVGYCTNRVHGRFVQSGLPTRTVVVQKEKIGGEENREEKEHVFI